jgi:hypothetical protein
MHFNIYEILIKAHCLYQDLNDKRPGTSSDSNFILKKKNKKINKYKREKQILWAVLDLPANQHSQFSPNPLK